MEGRHRSEREKDRARESTRRTRHPSADEDDYDSHVPSNKQTSRTAPRTGLQNYWIDGTGINREVLQRQICFMLGGEAKSKPDSYNGIPGYRISAVRPFTEAQLNDLMEISKEYDEERRDRRNKGGQSDISYGESRTSKKWTHPSDQDSSYPEDPRYGYSGRAETFSPNVAPHYQPQFGSTSGTNPGYPPAGRRSPPPPMVDQPYPGHGFSGNRQQPSYHPDHPRQLGAAQYSYYDDNPRGSNARVPEGYGFPYNDPMPQPVPNFGSGGGPVPMGHYNPPPRGYGPSGGLPYNPSEVPRYMPSNQPPMRQQPDYYDDVTMSDYRGSNKDNKHHPYDNYRKR